MIHVGTINISNKRKYFQYVRIKHGTWLHFVMTFISNKTHTSWLIQLIPGHSLWLSLSGPGHCGQSQNSGNNIAGLMWTLTNRSAGQLGVTWQNFIQCKIRAQGYKIQQNILSLIQEIYRCSTQMLSQYFHKLSILISWTARTNLTWKPKKKSSLYSLFNKSSKLDSLCVSVKTFVWTRILLSELVSILKKGKPFILSEYLLYLSLNFQQQLSTGIWITKEQVLHKVRCYCTWDQMTKLKVKNDSSNFMRYLCNFHDLYIYW